MTQTATSYIGLDPFEGTEIFSDNGLPALLKRGYIDFDPFEDTGS